MTKHDKNMLYHQNDKNINNFELTPEYPWTAAETTPEVALIRPHFHMVSWEFHNAPKDPQRQISATDWEHRNLISVIVMRDPINRLLAGSHYVSRNFPSEKDRTLDQWWEFANTSRITDNFAMRVLAGNGCCDGENTDVRYFNHAKALVERFTFVIDMACLDEGLIALADVLGLTTDFLAREKNFARKRKSERSARERIGHDEVYDFLVRRNHYDIQLYEWSKTRSLVDCSTLE